MALVLVRLLLPVAPQSALSLQNLIADTCAEEDAAVSDFCAEAQLYSSAVAESIPGSAAGASDEAAAEDYWDDLVGRTVLWLWLAGGALVIAKTLIVNYRFSRQVNCALLCHDVRVANLWQECCSRAGVHRTIAIILFDGVRQPAMMGLSIRGCCFPATWSRWRMTNCA